LAIYNLDQAQRLALDLELPRFARRIVWDANMDRVLLFGAVAGGCALIALLLGAIGRKAVAGKAALVLAGLVLAGTAYAQISRAATTPTFPAGVQDRDDDDRKRPEPPAREGSLPPAVPQAEQPIKNQKQGAFRLGRQVGLAALGRARGQAPAAERVFSKAQLNAKDLGVTLRPLPALSGNETKDSAEALHYLLDTVGKPVATALSAKYGPDHAAAFELGIKLNLLNLLYLPNDELGQGLGASCDKLAQRAGVSSASIDPLLSKIRSNQSQSAVGDAAVTAGDAIDRELASAPKVAPAQPKRQPSYRLDEQLH
jgi:hypothetical protein